MAEYLVFIGELKFRTNLIYLNFTDIYGFRA
jgi:hypothetical protein